MNIHMNNIEDMIPKFFKILGTIEGCVHCMNAREHAKKHGNSTQYITCKAHAFVNVCKSRMGEFENPSNNNAIIKPYEHIGSIGSIDGFEVLAIFIGVEVTTRTGEKAGLFPVLVAVVEHGEYVHRHHAVLVEKTSINTEGDVSVEWMTLLHDTESVNNVALATCLAGASAVDTCSNGEARESNYSMHVPFEQRRGCPACHHPSLEAIIQDETSISIDD